jgi:hypothetical protein
VRLHVSRHSVFDMCVPGSQNDMQSASVSWRASVGGAVRSAGLPLVGHSGLRVPLGIGGTGGIAGETLTPGAELSTDGNGCAAANDAVTHVIASTPVTSDRQYASFIEPLHD